MAKKRKRKKQQTEIEYYSSRKVMYFLSVLFVMSVVFWSYVNIYRPKERGFLTKARLAWRLIQDETIEIYNKQNYLFKKSALKKDDYCYALAQKLASGEYNCATPEDGGEEGFAERNFTIKGTKIDVLGLEQPAFYDQGTLAKDIIFDTDGYKKGANRIGIDRIPVRIYSTGRLGGMLAPVNCNPQDETAFGLKLSKFCERGNEINYLETTYPFSFDIYQIGANAGRTKHMRSDISYLRADCYAFSGDIMDVYEYCTRKAMYQFKTCFDETNCVMNLSTEYNLDRR